MGRPIARISGGVDSSRTTARTSVPSAELATTTSEFNARWVTEIGGIVNPTPPNKPSASTIWPVPGS